MSASSPTPKEASIPDMPTPSEGDQVGRLREVLARHHVYSVAGRLLERPDEEFFVALASGELVRELSLAAACLPESSGLDAAADALCRSWVAAGSPDAKALGERYECLFGHALSPDFPPYSTQYGGEAAFRQSQSMADICGYYSAFGLRVAAGRKERPDHLSIECEFMAFLALKEAHALEEGRQEQAELSRQAATRFLREHLGPAALGYHTLVSQACDDAFYAAGARLLAELAAWHRDRERRELAPVADPGRRPQTTEGVTL